MRVTVGGQEFEARDLNSKVTVSVFPGSRGEFEIEANKLLALSAEEFGEPDVYGAGGHHAWVSRETRDYMVEVTIFAPSGMNEQDIRDHLAGA
ncbi:esterase [Microbacterium phage Nike]|nr:esterase [Microbacterium phage Nike]